MEGILEKIKKIEALISGATTDGEKIAAIFAKQRILDKYPELETNRQQTEWTLHTPDTWHKKLLMALCRKYEIKPYRYARQKYTTVMVKINEDFLNKVLWPEYLEYSKHLEQLIKEITNDLINKIHRPENEEVIIQSKLQQTNG
ncbi:MAG: hypothetical protein COS14_05225 [Bacteroidetes bacterium CG02_land_8_20_14_3_00_31_25]|nr:MAG: hypothetical protein COS14_05225 [Bacteroidetes bacterium CG02_land_8_20_14_3_00_31_25]